MILGAVQNALIDYYDIVFVPPAETELSSESAVSAVGTVSAAIEAAGVAETSPETENTDEAVEEISVPGSMEDIIGLEDSEELDDTE